MRKVLAGTQNLHLIQQPFTTTLLFMRQHHSDHSYNNLTKHRLLSSKLVYMNLLVSLRQASWIMCPLWCKQQKEGFSLTVPHIETQLTETGGIQKRVGPQLQPGKQNKKKGNRKYWWLGFHQTHKNVISFSWGYLKAKIKSLALTQTIVCSMTCRKEKCICGAFPPSLTS